MHGNSDMQSQRTQGIISVPPQNAKTVPLNPTDADGGKSHPTELAEIGKLYWLVHLSDGRRTNDRGNTVRQTDDVPKHQFPRLLASSDGKCSIDSGTYDDGIVDSISKIAIVPLSGLNPSGAAAETGRKGTVYLVLRSVRHTDPAALHARSLHLRATATEWPQRLTNNDPVRVQPESVQHHGHGHHAHSENSDQLVASALKLREPN